MQSKGWYIRKIGASMYAIGWPDFYAFHILHGHRWIETKAPGGKLRKTQIREFNNMAKLGDKIYVLETYKDYYKLFNNDNWREYIRW